MMNIAPGGTGNTAWSQSEVNAHGGYTWYTCPRGYTPVDSSGNWISNGGTQQAYLCKFVPGS